MMEPKKNHSKRIFALFLMLLFVFSITLPVSAGGNDVIKYAGTGNVGKTDGSLNEASFDAPYGLAIDEDGGILVADSSNNLIRKILNGKVTTIAGVADKLNNFEHPKGGFADGDALTARFNNPRYLTVSPEGSIYVSDTGSHLIRKIFSGQVTTVAGIGKPGYIDGDRKTAAFNTPCGLAVDGNEIVYVADSLNHVIRAITPSGKISTYAGKNTPTGGYADGDLSSAMFNEPSSLAFGKDGALYVLDSGNQMIRKIFKGKVTTICGFQSEPIPGTNYLSGAFQDGYNIDGQMNFPKGMYIDGNDTIYVADTWNNAIRAITKNGKMVTISGSETPGVIDGTFDTASFNGPAGIVLIGSKLYVSELWNNDIREITINPKKIVGIKRKNPASEISFKAKSATPQIWVSGKKISIGKKDFLKKGTALYLSLPVVGKAIGDKVTWKKGASELIIEKSGKTCRFEVAKKPILLVSGVPMMDVRLLSKTLEYSSYSVPEYNAMVLYVK